VIRARAQPGGTTPTGNHAEKLHEQARTLTDAPQRVVGQAPGYLVVLDSLRVLQLVFQLQGIMNGNSQGLVTMFLKSGTAGASNVQCVPLVQSESYGCMPHCIDADESRGCTSCLQQRVGELALQARPHLQLL
jgi:hypothetical protein